MLADLPVESRYKGTDLIGSRCGEAPKVMGQTRDMISITLPEIGHRWNAAGRILIRDVPFRWNRGFDPIEYLYLFTLRKDHLFAHMSHDFIHQKDDRGSKLFG